MATCANVGFVPPGAGRCSETRSGTKQEGPCIALPREVHSIEFWQAYRAALGHSGAPAGRTVHNLIKAYKASHEFRIRSPITQRNYERYLAIIDEVWGTVLVSAIKPSNALRLDPAAATTQAQIKLTQELTRLGGGKVTQNSTDCKPIPGDFECKTKAVVCP